MSDLPTEISFKLSIPAHPAVIQSNPRELAQTSTMGLIFMMWGSVELAMEMRIKEALNLTTAQACIVCGPLGGGAKFNLLASLLAESEEHSAFVSAVRDFQSRTGRNALAHGFVTFAERDQPWVVVSREVKNKLTIKHRTLVAYYDDDFLPSFDRVMATSGFTDQEIHDYGLEIARLQLDG